MSPELAFAFKLIDGILYLLTRMPAMQAGSDALGAKLDLFKAEGRDPTPDEVAQNNADTDDLLAQLRAEADLGGEMTAERRAGPPTPRA
jgi:hypothetical protein